MNPAEALSLWCPPCNRETTHWFLLDHFSVEFQAHFGIYQCSGCLTKRTHPFLTEEQLKGYYSGEEITGAGLYHKWRKKYRYIHGWINRTLDTTGISVVEVGSGSGNLLRYFRESSGCTVTGLELSVPCREYSQKVNGVKVFSGPLACYRAEHPGEADLVIMVHLFEHIPDPVPFLKEVAGILKSRGHLYIELPNAFMIDFDLLEEPANPLCVPFHSFLYHIDSLCRLLEQNGFSVMARRYWSRKEDGGTITSSLAACLKKKISRKLGDHAFSRFLGGVAKGIVRFFPNRYFLGYYCSRRNRSTTIAVLCRRATD